MDKGESGMDVIMLRNRGVVADEMMSAKKSTNHHNMQTHLLCQLDLALFLLLNQLL